MSGRTGIRRAAIIAASASLALAAVPVGNVASAAGLDGPKLARNLTKNVTLEGVNRHLIAFQRIADRNDGNRAAGTTGYDASVEYVAGKLRGAGTQLVVWSLADLTDIKDPSWVGLKGSPTIVGKVDISSGFERHAKKLPDAKAVVADLFERGTVA